MRYLIAILVALLAVGCAPKAPSTPTPPPALSGRVGSESPQRFEVIRSERHDNLTFTLYRDVRTGECYHLVGYSASIALARAEQESCR